MIVLQNRVAKTFVSSLLIGLLTLSAVYSLFIQPAQAAAPTGFTSQTYEDSNGDGVIDQVVVVINGSEALTACTVTDAEIATDWTYVGNDIGGSLASSGDTHSCVTGTATVTLKITGANAATTGHSTAPTIAYDNDDADASITNASGTLGTVVAANAADGAAPVLSDFDYYDVDTDGAVDRFVVSFSETVTAASVLGDNDLSLTSLSDFVGAAFGSDTTDLITGSVSSIIMDLGTEATRFDTQHTNGQVTITTQNAFSLTDGTNTNTTLAAQSQVTYTDSAAPAVFWVQYRDSGKNGTVETLNIGWTEPAAIASVFASQNITVSNDGDFDSLQVVSSATDLITTRSSSVLLGNQTASTTIDTHDDSGTLALTLTGTFTLIDDEGNTNTQVELAGAVESAKIVDDADPIIKQFAYKDADADGLIDSTTLTFSETVTASSILALNDLSFDNVGDFTGLAFGTDNTDLITSSITTLDITFGTEATVVDTSEDSGLIDISQQNNYILIDTGNTNSYTGISNANIVYADAAAPVIASISPADGGSSSVDADIILTFSEAMDTAFVESTEFTVSPDPGAFTTTWSVSDSVVTLDSDTDFDCSQVYTVTTAEASIDAAAGTPTTLATTGPEDGDWTFTASCGGGGSSTTTPLPTYEALVLSPNGGESLTVGNNTEITWSTGGTGILSYVDLLLSTDGGSTYSVIAAGEVNDGAYTWIIPNSVTAEARVRIEAHNNLSPLATDDSDIDFSITAASTPVTGTPSDVTEPTTGTMGLSPVTGLMEEISVVNPGDLIRSPYFDTVYYIDNDFVRHPFFNETIYATWYDDFSMVKVVTDATLPTLSIGTNILPKPGVTWVKIQSTDKVYMVETNPLDEFKPTLRWVSSESLAEELIGTDWADYVIDIDVSLFGRFEFGTDLLNSSDASVDMNMMKKRVTLNV